MKNRDKIIRLPMIVLPGGRLPEKMTGGANGYDAFARAVVSPNEMDKFLPYLRKTLFDFKSLSCPSLVEHIFKDDSGEWVYRLLPGESVVLGLGFVVALQPNNFYWVAVRSGMYFKYEIEAIPTLVDSDYRGEPAVKLRNMSKKTFDISCHMRVAQIVFQEFYSPTFEMVDNYDDLPQTERGAKGSGSTGLT